MAAEPTIRIPPSPFDCPRRGVLGHKQMYFRPIILAALLMSAGCAAMSHPSDELPTEAELSRKPSLVRDWKERLLSHDSGVRAMTADRLAEGGEGSLPVLKRLVLSREEHVRNEAFEIVHRMGTDAIPLLAAMLASNRVLARHLAIDLLVDLSPAT